MSSPRELKAYKSVTIEELIAVVTKLKPNKALDISKLLNRVVKLITSLILEILKKLFSIYLRLGYYLEAF